MNLALSKDQELIKSSAREFLAKECPKIMVREIEESDSGHSEDLWRKMAELGWMGLMIPEEYGGTGMDPPEFVSLALLLEEMGNSLLQSPFFSTVVLGALAILDAGSDSQRQQFLPEIAKGRLKIGFAMIEPSGTYNASGIEARAVTASNGYRISGNKLFVEYGHIADYLIVAARTKQRENPEEGITLFLVDAKGPKIRIDSIPTIGLERQTAVYFDDAFVPHENIIGELDMGWALLENLLEKAAVAKCAEMLGGMNACLEMTNNYAKRRVQYGKVIGSYQVIQHYLSNIWMDIVASRELVYEAASMIEQGLPCKVMASMAKAWVGRALYRISEKCIQIHGAIGMTREYDIGLYHRQAKSWDLCCGSADSHVLKVGDAMKTLDTRDFIRNEHWSPDYDRQYESVLLER